MTYTLKKKFGYRLCKFLLVDEIRHIVSYLRYIYFAKIKNNLNTYSNPNEGVSDLAISHNLRNSILRDARPKVLIQPLSALSAIQSKVRQLKILDIGPRSESELLLLAGYGFSWQNIYGLDLVSYSPKIKLGDMHNIPYKDDEFDICIASRVIGYSKNMKQEIDEMMRVLKPGGLIAINEGDLTEEQVKAKERYTPGAKDRQRLSGLDDLITLMGASNIDQIYLQHDPIKQKSEKRGSIILVATINKQSNLQSAA